MKDVHAPLALIQTAFEETLKVSEARVWRNDRFNHCFQDEPCLFRAALLHWRELNLSEDFVSFSRKALPLSESLPLLVHSWREVLELWMDHADRSDDEALRALLE